MFYLDHGYKRHHSLHVFLQLRQSSQLAGDHFVVWKGPVVALDGRTNEEEEEEKKTWVRDTDGKCSRETKSNAELLRLTTDLGEIIT